MELNKIKQLIDEIFIAVADNKISIDSQIVIIAASMLKELKSQSLNQLDLPNDENRINSFRHRGKRTSMFEHAIDVCKLILENKKDFSLACIEVAGKKSISTASVWQACCRSLNLKAKNWNDLFKGDTNSKFLIQNSLLKKYPEYKDFIQSLFGVK